MSDDLYHVDLTTVEASTLFILHLLYIPSLRATLKEATQRLPGPKGKRVRGLPELLLLATKENFLKMTQ